MAHPADSKQAAAAAMPPINPEWPNAEPCLLILKEFGLERGIEVSIYKKSVQVNFSNTDTPIEIMVTFKNYPKDGKSEIKEGKHQASVMTVEILPIKWSIDRFGKASHKYSDRRAMAAERVAEAAGQSFDEQCAIGDEVYARTVDGYLRIDMSAERARIIPAFTKFFETCKSIADIEIAMGM